MANKKETKTTKKPVEKKTTVNDIIGLVKTEERTDSVELKKELYK